MRVQTVTVFPNSEALSQAAAEAFVALAKECVSARGRFYVALSGGSTPNSLFRLLAQKGLAERTPWSSIEVYWGDDRLVPPTDTMSNEHQARENLLSHVEIPEAQIHPIFREGAPEEIAEAYEATIKATLPDTTLDLLMLGVGPDGHTASLFPGQPAVHETERLVVPSIGVPPVRERVTMTPPLLNRARNIWFLAAGPDKSEPLERIFHGEINLDETPAQVVARQSENVSWFLDEVAAARIHR